MNITDYFLKEWKPLISFELTPPKRGESVKSLEPIIETLAAYHPPWNFANCNEYTRTL